MKNFTLLTLCFLLVSSSGVMAQWNLGGNNLTTSQRIGSNTNYSLIFETNSTTKAELVITSVTGQKMKQIPLSNAGLVKVDTSTLSPGIYFYSLYVEKNLVDTRKMVIER